MELYIARHGETQSNHEKRLTGRNINSPLTKKGIEQAKSLRKMLENIDFDAVYTSPLKRAVDTINIALGDRGRNYKIIIDERLSEINLGIMEGMLYSDVSVKFPESGMLFMTDPVSYIPPPDGEHLADMLERIDSFFSDLIKMNYEKVFILTHGFALRVIYACITDKSIAAIGKSPCYLNCELVQYKYNCDKWERVK